MMLGLGLQMASTGKRGTASGGGFLAGSTLDMKFNKFRYFGATPSSLTVTRAGTNATDLTYDQTSRTSYNSFAANTARIVADGRGLLVEGSRTQYLGVTDAPANQTTSSLGTGSYTLWCIGGTSVTVAAGSATITGGGAATPGTPLTFTVTGAGTVTVTVSGAVRYFQIENGAFATSYIPNAGAAGSTSVRAADIIALTGTAFSSWYTNASAGWLYAEFGVSSNTAGNDFAAQISDNSYNNRIFVGMDAATFIDQAVASGSTTLSQTGLAARNTNAINKIVFTWNTNDGRAAVNGSTAGTPDVSGAVPTGLTQLNLGSDHGGFNNLDGFLRRVAYGPGVAVNAFIQAITT